MNSTRNNTSWKSLFYYLLAHCLATVMLQRRQWQPTPVFLPRECRGQRSLVGCCPWDRTESDTTEATQHACMHWRRKWQSTPVFLPRESQGQRSLVGCRLWGHTESDTSEATKQQHQQHIVIQSDKVDLTIKQRKGNFIFSIESCYRSLWSPPHIHKNQGKNVYICHIFLPFTQQLNKNYAK